MLPPRPGLPVHHSAFRHMVSSLLAHNTRKTAEDLKRFLHFPRINIREDVGHGKPLASIDFGTDLDDEHGRGVTIDGSAILGVGYSYDFNTY